MNQLKNTESKILEAAKAVFHKRGYNGTRMQEIADEAGINKALLHYYFRNKETLFKKVFLDSFSIMAGKMSEIFLSEMTFLSKIEIFVGYYLQFITNHSYVPFFIINALHEKPEELKTIILTMTVNPKKLLELIRIQAREELKLEIDPLHIYISVLSLVVFPVIAKPLIQMVFDRTDNQMTEFFEQRKKIVPAFILNAIKGYEKVDLPCK